MDGSRDAVAAAERVLDRFASPAIAAHSRRSAEWALLLGRALRIPPADAELLRVAALLHDVGLAPDFDAAESPYEDAGGSVAWAVGAGAGWDDDRCDRLREVIIRHNWPSVPIEDADGHLLERATALDVRGVGAELLDPDDVREVLRRFPRDGFAAEFRADLVDQAARKPHSAAARILASGGPADPHPHDPLPA